MRSPPLILFFFFNDTATTEIYTLSYTTLFRSWWCPPVGGPEPHPTCCPPEMPTAALLANAPDRKSTRLNSSHTVISYAVFCLKKKSIFPQKLPVDYAGNIAPLTTCLRGIC